MSDEKNYGKVQLAPISRVDGISPELAATMTESPAFIGDGEINGEKMTVHAYPRRDFMDQHFLLVKFADKAKSFGCLHKNPYRTSKNKAPQLQGRACVDGTMLRMVAWQNEDYRGVPVLSISFQTWDSHLKEAEDFRQNQQQNLPGIPACSETVYGADAQTDDIPF